MITSVFLIQNSIRNDHNQWRKKMTVRWYDTLRFNNSEELSAQISQNFVRWKTRMQTSPDGPAHIDTESSVSYAELFLMVAE